MDKTRAMVKDIKEQVLAELEREQSLPNASHGRGFQAYCQLVDAVREEVLLDLRSQNQRIGKAQISPAELEMIKQEIIKDLQMEHEQRTH